MEELQYLGLGRLGDGALSLCSYKKAIIPAG